MDALKTRTRKARRAASRRLRAAAAWAIVVFGWLVAISVAVEACHAGEPILVGVAQAAVANAIILLAFHRWLPMPKLAKARK